MSVIQLQRQKAFPIAKSLPLEVGILHFVGIGGIGMSGIAEILHNLGYKVQGSDIAENANVERLRKLGIKIAIGHKPENIENASALVISSAVKQDNPEFMEARANRIPIVRRSEMLSELMRLKMSVSIAGTHGKTTTTSLMATLFDAAELSPTVINGGIINSYGTNARNGSGEWMVVEADESDGTFIKLPSTIAVITNIDPEHLDYFGSFENLRSAFLQFVENIPFYGFAVMCIDHPIVQELIGEIHNRRIISYGFTPQADVRAVNIKQVKGGQVFDIELAESKKTIKDIFLPMYGEHNIRNALAVSSVAQELKMSDEVLKQAFASFGGVKRRFTQTGIVRGVTIIDDYAHHPVEIQATLKAARQSLEGSDGKVIAVVQPHRYTRLRDLFSSFCTCFNDADCVIVTEVYSAGENPIEGINRDSLVQGLINAGHKNVAKLDNSENLAQLIKEKAKSGDLVVCLGAGSITKWANSLPKELEEYV
ncbi:MAG: UDP-N-acetylmuramate--L-alanine ligase [Pseudomonadota bacterium]